MSTTLPKIIGFTHAIPPVERSPFAHGDHRGSLGNNPFPEKGKPYTAGARDRKAGAKVVGGCDGPPLDEFRQWCDHSWTTARRPYLATPTPIPYIPLTGGRGNMAPLTGENVDMWL